MNPDPLQQAWKAQHPGDRVWIDSELLLKEVQRNQTNFNATLFWRDFREVGVALVLLPVWLILGWKLALPWSWFLTVPVLLWLVVFLLRYGRPNRAENSDISDTLTRSVAISMAQIEHQIWLLRTVTWWCLLPLGSTLVAFLVHITLLSLHAGWIAVLLFSINLAAVGGVFYGVYWLNQNAIRSSLKPRRQELKEILMTLCDRDTGGDNNAVSTPIT